MVSYKIITELLFLQNSLCPICKKTLIGADFHVHHIDKDRNNNQITNFLLLHPECHRFLHGKDEEIENDKIEFKKEKCDNCGKVTALLNVFMKQIVEAFEQQKTLGIESYKPLVAELFKIYSIKASSTQLKNAVENCLRGYYSLETIKQVQEIFLSIDKK